jgi:hypothetical protein
MKKWEGLGKKRSCVIGALSRYFLGWTEENHERSQSE